jgi:hypothetical protein
MNMADRNKSDQARRPGGRRRTGALVLLRKGKGWGGGRGGGGGPPHCKLRLGSAGLTLDGQPVTIAGAASRCGGGRADLVVAGDANYGELQKLRAALKDGGVAASEMIVRFDGASGAPAGG